MPNIAISPSLHGLDSKYRFLSLPVEEADATATAYVCRFKAGAGADETGVGGGLAGANLVLKQSNSPGATVGGYRPIAKGTAQAFGVTLPFVNAAVQSAAGFSGLWRYKDIDPSAAVYMGYLGSTGNDGLLFQGNMNTANRRTFGLYFSAYSATDKVGTNFNNADTLSSNPTAPEFMFLISSDYATKTSVAGIVIGTAQPKSFSDFLYFTMSRGDTAFTGALAMAAFAGGNQDSVVGCRIAGNLAAGVKVASLTFAQYPCIVPV